MTGGRDLRRGACLVRAPVCAHDATVDRYNLERKLARLDVDRARARVVRGVSLTACDLTHVFHYFATLLLLGLARFLTFPRPVRGGTQRTATARLGAWLWGLRHAVWRDRPTERAISRGPGLQPMAWRCAAW